VGAANLVVSRNIARSRGRKIGARNRAIETKGGGFSQKFDGPPATGGKFFQKPQGG